MKSWKTSAGGIVQILCAIAHVFNKYKQSGTVDIGAEDAALLAGGIALLNARDNKVTSEQAGAAPILPKPE